MHDQLRPPLKSTILTGYSRGHDRSPSQTPDTPAKSTVQEDGFVGIGGQAKVLRRLKARMTRWRSKCRALRRLALNHTLRTITIQSGSCTRCQQYICPSLGSCTLDMFHANWRGESTYQGELASCFPGLRAGYHAGGSLEGRQAVAFFVSDMINMTLQQLNGSVGGCGRRWRISSELAADSPTRVYTSARSRRKQEAECSYTLMSCASL